MKQSTVGRSGRPVRQQGLSLIELLVALAIGSFLLLGLVQVFSASRTAYQMAEGVSRTQENGRFALDFLQRDLRMAGHFGCINDQAHLLNGTGHFNLAFAAGRTAANYNAVAWPLRFHVSIQGYEAQNTAPDDTLTLAASPMAGGGVWSPALPSTALAAEVVPGSDVIAVRYLVPESVPVTSFVATPTAASTIGFDTARWDMLRSGVTAPQLFGIADCANITVFAGGRTGGVITTPAPSGGQNGFQERYEPGRASLHRAESVIYYVGINGAGQPALFRRRASQANGSLDPREELVEGIETLQIAYGLSMESRGRPTGQISALHTADEIGDAATSAAALKAWRMVGMVQVGLIARSPDLAAAPSRTTANPHRVLGLTIAAPAGDTRARAVYETSLAVRNRLFGN